MVNAGRYSGISRTANEKGSTDTMAELLADSTPEPPSPKVTGRRGYNESAASGSLHSASPSPAASMTPSPSTFRPGLIYRPPDYPSVLFATKEGLSDEEASQGGDEEGGISERTTSASLHIGGSGLGDMTPSDSYRDDEGGGGGTWMYPTSDIESSVDDEEDTPPQSMFAPHMSSLSSSHNQLTRISSLGTAGGSFSNEDTVLAAAAAVTNGRKGRVRSVKSNSET